MRSDQVLGRVHKNIYTGKPFLVCLNKECRAVLNEVLTMNWPFSSVSVVAMILYLGASTQMGLFTFPLKNL